MKLDLIRIYKAKTYTIGKLYINGVYFCDTLEDKDRGLTQKMSKSDIDKIKVMHETAIPIGTYKLTINEISPRFKKIYPRLKDVPGFDGILIHSGNTDKDSSGCILVGQNSQVGKVINSKLTYDALFKVLESANDEITITIKYE